MRPVDLQVIGTELAIRWDDGSETFLPLAVLRAHCPCASCGGERDIFGNVYKGPSKALSEASTRLTQWVPVGGYAIQPIWGDGHNTGLYTFEYLRRLGTVSRD